MSDIKNINNKRESILSFIEKEFLQVLKNSFKDNLLSVMLYGSILKDNFIQGVSDINILIIIKEADFDQIEEFGKISFKILKKHRITPLILTKTEFINSADVFPLEYFDIKENNRVIYGNDETADLELTDKNLRHQIEAGLRGNLTRLRQIIVASKGKERILREFFKPWSGSIFSIFRGLVRLKGEKASDLDLKQLLKKVEVLYSINSDYFLQLLSIKAGKKNLELKDTAKKVHNELVKLIKIVDKYITE